MNLLWLRLMHACKSALYMLKRDLITSQDSQPIKLLERLETPGYGHGFLELNASRCFHTSVAPIERVIRCSIAVGALHLAILRGYLGFGI